MNVCVVRVLERNHKYLHVLLSLVFMLCLCYGLITRSDESYHLCMYVCV